MRAPFQLLIVLVAAAAGCEQRDAPAAAEERAPVTAPAPAPTPTSTAAAATPSGEAAAPATATPAPTAAPDTTAEPRKRSEKEAPPTGVPGAVASVAPTASASAAAVAPTATATAEPEPPPKQVMSEKAVEGSYNLWMQSAGRAKVGQTSYVEVVLVAKGDFHCNDKYPYKLKLGAPAPGVSYPQPVVRDIAITPVRSVMRVPFTATAPGETRVGGTFHFSVCTEKQCKIESREVGLAVKVEG